MLGLSQILCIPLLINYLGATSYALFAIAISLQGWWLLADIGIGNSIQNYISEKKAHNKSYHELIAASFILTITAAALILIALFYFRNSISSIVFPKTNIANQYGPNLIFTTGTLFTLTSLGLVSSKIQYAEGKGYISNILITIGTLIGLSGLYYLSYNNKFSSTIFASAVWIAPTGILLSLNFACIVLLNKKISLASIYTPMILLLKRGFQFFLIGLLSATTLLIDYIIAGKILTDGEIIKYNVCSKLFSSHFSLYSAALAALSPSYTKLIALGNWDQINKNLKKSILFGFITIITFALILWFNRIAVFRIFHINGNEISGFFMTLLVLYWVTRIWSDAFTIIILSASKLKLFIMYIPLQAIISYMSQIYFSNIYGINGILFGLIVSFITTSVWILPCYYINIKRDYELL